MDYKNIVVDLCSLFEEFLRKISVQPDVVTLSFCPEKLLETPLDDKAVLEHLPRFVGKIKLLQEKWDKNMQEFGTLLSSPPLKKLKKEGEPETTTVNDNAVEEDTSLVQVKAGKAEIDRRISAFIQRKRVEVDLLNKREFCNVVNTETNNEFQCARTDAVFVHRLGQKGHIKATRVENTSTTSEALALGPEISNTSTTPLDARACPGVEERLRNLETHFGYKPGRPLPCDVYKRLTNLEEKVLYLEGMSPEYFSQNTQNIGHGRHPRRKGNDSSQNLTLHSIDERIRSLRSSLSKTQAS